MLKAIMACRLRFKICKITNKYTYMKKFSKSIRFMLATLLVVVVSQASVLAEGNSSAGPATGLSAGQIAGAFALLVFVILVPLVKSSNKAVAQK
jgi:hypothetical protein